MNQVKNYNIKDFPRRLASELKSSGLKQSDLATRLNVSEGSVSGWVKGSSKPYRKTIDALAEIFGVRAEWLMDGALPRQPEHRVEEKAGSGATNRKKDPIPSGSTAGDETFRPTPDQAAIAKELHKIATSLERLACIIHPGGR